MVKQRYQCEKCKRIYPNEERAGRCEVQKVDNTFNYKDILRWEITDPTRKTVFVAFGRVFHIDLFQDHSGVYHLEEAWYIMSRDPKEPAKFYRGKKGDYSTEELRKLGPKRIDTELLKRAESNFPGLSNKLKVNE